MAVMNLVIDSGNSRFKAGLFDGNTLQQMVVIENASQLKGWLGQQTIKNVLVSSVNYDAQEIISWAKASAISLVLTHELPLPIQVKYDTPKTLGMDRLAAACGAAGLFPNQNCLVIDSGTCINYEFIDQHNTYWGGAISPGITMRFQAMHTFTSRLPLLSPHEQSELIGSSTDNCMQSGVLNGTLAEVQGIIDEYRRRYPDIRVILSGGDFSFFENNLKQPIFVAPDLVLGGLNRILCYHAKIG